MFQKRLSEGLAFDGAPLALIQQIALISGTGLYLPYLAMLQSTGSFIRADNFESCLSTVSPLCLSLLRLQEHTASPPMLLSEIKAQETIAKQLRTTISSCQELARPPTVSLVRVLAWCWVAHNWRCPKRSPITMESTFDSAIGSARELFLSQPTASPLTVETLDEAARAVAWRAPLHDNQGVVNASIATLVLDLVAADPTRLVRVPRLVYTLSVTLGRAFISDVALPCLHCLLCHPDTSARAATAGSLGSVIFSAVVAHSSPKVLARLDAVLAQAQADGVVQVREAAVEALAALSTESPSRGDKERLTQMCIRTLETAAGDEESRIRLAGLKMGVPITTRNPTSKLMQLVLSLSHEAASSPPSSLAEAACKSVAVKIPELASVLPLQRWAELAPIVAALVTSPYEEVRCMVADSLGHWPTTPEEDECTLHDLEVPVTDPDKGGLEPAWPFVRIMGNLLQDSVAEVRTAAALAGPRLLSLAPLGARSAWLSVATHVYAAATIDFTNEHGEAAIIMARGLPAFAHYSTADCWEQGLLAAHICLSRAHDANVRRCIAASLTIALALAPLACNDAIVSTAWRLIEDPNVTVRKATLINLPEISVFTSARDFVQLVAVWCEEGTQHPIAMPPSQIWHPLELREVRASMASRMATALVLATQKIGEEAAIASSVALATAFVKLCLGDSSSSVRELAVESLPDLYTALYFEQAKRVLFVGVLNGLAASASALQLSTHTFLQAARHLLTVLPKADCNAIISKLALCAGSRLAGKAQQIAEEYHAMQQQGAHPKVSRMVELSIPRLVQHKGWEKIRLAHAATPPTREAPVLPP